MKKVPIPNPFEMINKIQCLAIEFEAFGMIQTAYDPTFKINTEEEIKKIIPTAVVRNSSLELVETRLVDKYHFQHIIDWCADVKAKKEELEKSEEEETEK